jgi:hypothetical protein
MVLFSEITMYVKECSEVFEFPSVIAELMSTEGAPWTNLLNIVLFEVGFLYGVCGVCLWVLANFKTMSILNTSVLAERNRANARNKSGSPVVTRVKKLAFLDLFYSFHHDI